MWLLALLSRVVRNELRYKRLARRGLGQVKAVLTQRGHRARVVRVHLGLAGPETLSCDVYLRSDAELERFQQSDVNTEARQAFRAALEQAGYPAHAIPHVEVIAHSDETNTRMGPANYYRR